jgi:hypothetical protein
MEKTKPVIPPSTGRRVLLFIGTAIAAVATNDKSRPFDAGIAYVWGDTDPVKNTINVGYRDHGGVAHSHTSVPLYDRAQDDQDAHGKGETYAVWMPYQFEQALRAQQPREPMPAAARVPDVQLVKLSDGDQPAGTGRVDPAAEGIFEEGDGGVLVGTNRATSGAIGQP